MSNIITTNVNTNVVQVTSPGPLGPRGAAGPIGPPGTITGNSGVNSTGSSVFSGSVTIIGTLTVTGSNTFINIGPALFTGSVDISGSLSAITSSAQYFSGSGAGLFNIPASAISGLNVSTFRIASGSVSASVQPGVTNFTVNNGGSTLFTISNAGLGTFANGLTVNSGATNLNAGLSVSNGATLNGGTTVNTSLTVNGTATVNGRNVVTSDAIGAISASGLNITTGNTTINSPTIALLGSATLNGQPITTAGDLTLDKIKSGIVTASVSAGANSFTVESAGTTLFRISNTGILSGSGANLFNIPASGITGLNLSQIGSGSFTASIADNKFKVNTNTEITGSLIVTAGVTGSFSGSFQGDGTGLTNVPASGVVGLNLSQIATGSITSSVNLGTTNFQVASGSTSLLSLDYTGKLIVSKSVNAGIPTSNNWQSGLQGSYFNNFTSNSDVSEILRFMAGLLSASAPDAVPNTRTYAAISENLSNTGTTSAPAGNVPQSSTTADIIYLTGKGFTAAGNTLFPGKTIYNNTGYSISYSSTAGGSTTVTSSADAQLFGLGLLSSGNATPLYVSGTINWFYSDNNSETVTAVSQSQNLLSNSSFGTTNGLTVAKINTVNPAVIPPAYQDGKFATVFSSALFNAGLNINGRSSSNVSSSGWYHISASIAIATGSSPYSSLQSITERIFWSPISSITIPAQTKGVGYFGFQALTVTSRSLSGAPYLTAATWRVSSSVTGIFNPMYSSNTTNARQAVAGNVSISNGGTGASQATTDSNGLITSPNTVYDSTGVTVRATNTIPFETDLIKLTGSLSLNIGTSNNITQTSISPTTFTVDTYGRDRAGTEGTTLNTQTIFYHTASAFGQPASSGSMAYYGQAQGYDGGSLTGNSEAFTGESYRVQITNKFLSGSYSAADAWATTFGLYNLGALDLQVKPSYLVRPGGTYRYWLTDPDNTKTYKFYGRAFQRSSATAATALTLNLGTTLVAWDSTTPGVAAAILFKSSGILNFATPRIYDPTQLTSNLISASIANDNQRNPFTTNIALYGNTGGSLNSTTYTIPLRGADGMSLDGTNQDYIILVRYTGDQAPISSITVSYS
jgi:hypothetical protein